MALSPSSRWEKTPLAHKIAAKSTVLVKNDGNLLPFDLAGEHTNLTYVLVLVLLGLVQEARSATSLWGRVLLLLLGRLTGFPGPYDSVFWLPGGSRSRC